MESSKGELSIVILGYIRNEFKCLVSTEMLREETSLIKQILDPSKIYPFFEENKLRYLGKDKEQLNEDQEKIVMGITEDVINRLDNPNIFTVEGGPGTGKTCTIVNLILEIIRYGMKVHGRHFKFLICSVSNMCINEITSKLLNMKLKSKGEVDLNICFTK